MAKRDELSIGQNYTACGYRWEVIEKLGTYTYKVEKKSWPSGLYVLKIVDKYSSNIINEVEKRNEDARRHTPLGLYNHCRDDDSVMLFIYYNKGSLHEYLKRVGRIAAEHRLRVIAYTMAETIHTLHEKLNIYHGDLNPNNMFVSQSDGSMYGPYLKIAGYKYLKFLKKDEKITIPTGNWLYRAPEMFTQSSFKKKCRFMVNRNNFI